MPLHLIADNPILPDPEAVYGELLWHVQRCPTCHRWRDELWKAERLCEAGQILAGAYADAEVAASPRRPALVVLP
jgi:hypothetical protein